MILPDNGLEPQRQAPISHLTFPAYIRPTEHPTGFWSLPRSYFETLGVLGVWEAEPQVALSHLLTEGQLCEMREDTECTPARAIPRNLCSVRTHMALSRPSCRLIDLDPVDYPALFAGGYLRLLFDSPALDAL